MKEYFVRHGESISNVHRVFQKASDPLTQAGLIQAKKLALRFKDIKIDVVISSDYIRAMQTAHEINEVVDKQIITTPLLREVKMPSYIEGKSHHDDYAKIIRKQVEENYDNPIFRYEDEENFHDLIKRAKEYDEFVKNLKCEHILVVTHGGFLKVIMGRRAFGENFDYKLFKKFDEFFWLDNCGITVCETEGDQKPKLRQWNDVYHLT